MGKRASGSGVDVHRSHAKRFGMLEHCNVPCQMKGLQHTTCVDFTFLRSTVEAMSADKSGA